MTTPSAPTHLPDSAEVNAVYRKVSWRLIPFLFICYTAAYLDRVNVGFAKLQMLDELKFSDAVYGLGAGMFFVGYIIFEVPSNVILQKVGAKLWIARIMFTWAIISGAMALVTTPMMFYVLRFLLGVAEAGFIPGILFYLTKWYPAARRGRVFALFLAAIPVASIFGGPLSGWILQTFHGSGGLSGWQWMFIIEAIPSLLLTFAVLKWLDNSHKSAKWLTDREKFVVEHSLAEDVPVEGHAHSFGAAMRSGKVWLLSVIYFTICMGIYVNSFWLPTIIQRSGVSSALTIGLLTAVPYTVAVIAMIANSSHADRTGERRWHTIIPTLVTAGGLILTGIYAGSPLMALVGLVLAAAGASTAQAAFWSLPAAFMSGVAAAAGIALVNSVGNIAGLVSTSVVGWMSNVTGSTTSSLYAIAALLVVGALLILAIPAKVVNDKGLADTEEKKVVA